MRPDKLIVKIRNANHKINSAAIIDLGNEPKVTLRVWTPKINHVKTKEVVFPESHGV